jgi:hypothetical protein
MQKLPYLEKGVDLNSRLGDAGKRALCTLASTPQTSEGTGIVGNVELGLPLELVLEVVQEGIVEVLSAKMGVTIRRLNGENTTADVQKGNIESSSTEIENEDVFLGLRLPVETVGDGGSSGLIDDPQNVKASNGTSVFGGQTLGVVEVSGDAVKKCQRSVSKSAQK